MSRKIFTIILVASMMALAVFTICGCTATPTTSADAKSVADQRIESQLGFSPMKYGELEKTATSKIGKLDDCAAYEVKIQDGVQREVIEDEFIEQLGDFEKDVQIDLPNETNEVMQDFLNGMQIESVYKKTIEKGTGGGKDKVAYLIFAKTPDMESLYMYYIETESVQ